MKYVDEYRDPQIALAIAQRIAAKVTRPWVLMEVCGGQTHTLMRYGMEELLPKEVELVHGPGVRSVSRHSKWWIEPFGSPRFRA